MVSKIEINESNSYVLIVVVMIWPDVFLYSLPKCRNELLVSEQIFII